MSIWSKNPEWFDVWLEEKALAGDLGAKAQKLADEGNFLGYEQWENYLELGSQATEDYCTRLAP